MNSEISLIRLILRESVPTFDAKLAPNPAAMIEAITADPMAVGYIPGSWLAEDIQTISVERELQAALARPILALTDTEPVGNFLNYLVCLQNSEP